MKWGILAFVGFMLMSGEADNLVAQVIYSGVGMAMLIVSLKKLTQEVEEGAENSSGTK